MNFERLELKHYELLKPYFESQPFGLSVFSAVSVFTWRNEAGFSVHFGFDENDTLIMAALNPQSPKDSYLALPLPPDPYSPEKLKELALKLGFDSFDLAPEAYLDIWGTDRVSACFELSEQDKYADYVYKTSNLANLPGHQFSKKRNLIKQFEREYVESDRVEIVRISKDLASECKDFIDSWYHDKERENDSDDQKAAIRTIDEFDELELTGIAIRIDDTVSGIGTCARLTDEMGVMNLELADHEKKGLYQFLDRECASRLFAGRFEYINKESDMGLPGLKQSKRSYHPDSRVRCFKLSVK